MTGSKAVHQHRFACAAERLEPRTLLSTSAGWVASPQLAITPAALNTTVKGYTPSQIRKAYGFDKVVLSDGSVPADGRGQTIAIVDAFHHPRIAEDLAIFDEEFGIPAPPSFSIVNQNGRTDDFPDVDAGWAGEIALDVEWAHAIAPGADILLVEAESASIDDLMTAVNYARRQPNVTTVSMSWGGNEFFAWPFGGEQDRQKDLDDLLTTPRDHQGVTFVAAAGDSGQNAGVLWPSASPNVLSVGGTSLYTKDSIGRYEDEKGWAGTNGGYSTVEDRPGYQRDANDTFRRSTADVAYVADPNTGVAVYNSVEDGGRSGWQKVGGTSAGAPQWAALIAIANQGRALVGKGSLDGRSETLEKLYNVYDPDGSDEYHTAFHDIDHGGSSGEGFLFPFGIFGTASSPANDGYDTLTGLGSPRAQGVMKVLVGKPGPTPSDPSVSPIAATFTASPPANVIGGTDGKLKLRLANTTDGNFNDRLTVTIYASADNVLSSEDRPIAALSYDTLKLPAFNGKNARLKFTYPADLTPGSYFLIAQSNATATDTTPVANATATQVAVAAPVVDLESTFARAPVRVVSGRTASASLVIRNLGNVLATGTVSVNLFASADAIQDVGDALLTGLSGKVIKIKPGKALKLKLKFAAPMDLTAGAFSLIGTIASTTRPADTDTANDTAVTGTAA
jgi:subtilase family serine protease